MLLAITLRLLVELKDRLELKWVMLTGLVFGLSIWAKLPAILFVSEFFLVWWLMPSKTIKKQRFKSGGYFLLAAGLGIVMLYSLRVSELFPFLFNRGGDFTYGLGELWLTEKGGMSLNLRPIWENLIRWGRWQIWYSSIGLWVVLILGQLIPKRRRLKNFPVSRILILMAIVMVGYFVVAGKILYSRYFLPMIIFLIPAAALILEVWWLNGRKYLVWLLGGLILGQALWFMYPWFVNVNQIKLEKEDKGQYLTDWSAGFGNKQVSEFIKQKASDGEVVVATEGFFGTLPDGLSIYFDGSPLNEQVEIFGIGQPIKSIPMNVREASSVKDTYLIVNEHRLEMPIEACCELIAKYPRPYGGPSLYLLRVNKL
jgi:hypothetical protein